MISSTQSRGMASTVRCSVSAALRAGMTTITLASRTASQHRLRRLARPPQFALVGLMWGGSFMFIKIEVEAGIAPVHVALLRCLFGGLALLLILRFTRDRLPRGEVWRHLVVIALLSNT